MNPKIVVITLGVAAALWGGCAGPGYVAVSTPPPAQYEAVPVARPGYYWVRGHWEWRYGRNVWIAGHWVRARERGQWIEGHYETRGGSYFWVEGHWR